MTTGIQSIDSTTTVVLVNGIEAFRVKPGGITGAVVQTAYAEYTTNADLTATIPFDDTIPQNNEGTQILSVNLTPKATTNKVRLRFQSHVFCATGGINIIAAISSSASTNALRTGYTSNAASGFSSNLVVEYEYVPGVTTPLTFSVRIAPQTANAIRLNGGASRLFGGSMASTLIVEEFAA